jgi:hypothetical protein
MLIHNLGMNNRPAGSRSTDIQFHPIDMIITILFQEFWLQCKLKVQNIVMEEREESIVVTKILQTNPASWLHEK